VNMRPAHLHVGNLLAVTGHLSTADFGRLVLGVLHDNAGPDWFRPGLPEWSRRLIPAGWGVTRARIFERDGFACQYCGATSGPLHCDHIVPVSRGGSDDDENLCAACVPCNLSKGAKLLSEWRS
jgi:hypothetical protein